MSIVQREKIAKSFLTKKKPEKSDFFVQNNYHSTSTTALFVSSFTAGDQESSRS